MKTRLGILILLAVSTFFCESLVGFQAKEGGVDELSEARLAELVDSPSELSKYLLKGGSPNARSISGKTLMVEACFRERIDTVETLIEAGASIDEGFRHFSPPLITAFVHTPEDLFLLLIARGADVNIATKSNGDTVLHLMATGDFVTRIYGSAIDQPEAQEEWIKKAIARYAVKEKRLIQLLFEKGAKLDKKNNEGLTPVDVARKHGVLRLVKLFEIQAERERRASNKSKALEGNKKDSNNLRGKVGLPSKGRLER